MKKLTRNHFLIATALLVFVASGLNAQQKIDNKIQPVVIQSRWAKEVSPTKALKEYPRPQMGRLAWTNLNGLWDYAITAKGAARPSAFDGQILVLYPIESALSGVKKSLLPSQNLWYKRLFAKPALKAGEKVKLNFGAVDYQATVFVNGTQVGRHEGGYTEFSFDITSALKAGDNEIAVKVFDPTGEGVGPHCKQVLKPEKEMMGTQPLSPHRGDLSIIPLSVAFATSLPQWERGMHDAHLRGLGRFWRSSLFLSRISSLLEGEPTVGSS